MDASDRSRLDARLRRLAAGAAPAILLGDGSSNDLSFARSLAPRGIPVIRLAGRDLLGSFTRHGLRVRLPPVEEGPEEWLACLERVAATVGGRPVLFALADAHCAFLARNQAALEPGFRFLQPDPDTVETILDKRRQYDAAQAAGIPPPATRYPERPEDLAAIAAQLEFPVLLKPYTAHLGRPWIENRKVVVVAAPDDLAPAWSACVAGGARFLVQEVVPGGDDAIVWYSAYWDGAGRERAWFTARKLRQYPPGFGDGCFQRTIDDPEVRERSVRLLEALGYRGLVFVEFKRDPRDGHCRLMEINPRTASGNQLGIDAGVDLPWIAYRDLAGLDPAPAPTPRFRPDVRYVHEEWDVQSFAAMRRSGELTLGGWLRSLAGARPALFAWDDPGPLVVGVWRGFVRGARAVFGRIRPGRGPR